MTTETCGGCGARSSSIRNVDGFRLCARCADRYDSEPMTVSERETRIVENAPCLDYGQDAGHTIELMTNACCGD